MQGAEDHVPGFRRLECQPDRFQVPHLADEDDIRVFTQRLVEAQRVAVQRFGRPQERRRGESLV